MISEKANYGGSAPARMVGGGGGERGKEEMNTQSAEGVQGSQNALQYYRDGHVSLRIVQTHGVYDTQSEPLGDLWALGGHDVSMEVHQPQHVSHLVGTLMTGETVCGQGDGKSLYPPLNFAVDLKLLQNNHVFEKR